MGMFFIYSIKVAICLAAFYLFYKLLLSRDTFHAFNRATLLLLMLLSLVLPFVNISVDEPTVAYDGMVQIEQQQLRNKHRALKISELGGKPRKQRDFRLTS